MSKTRIHILSEVIRDNPQLVPLDKSQINYLINVLRCKTGDFVEIFDGEGNDYRAVVHEHDGRFVLKVVLAHERTDLKPAVRIFVAVAVPKGKKINLIIQKLVEIGVSGIFLLRTKRTVVNVKDAKAKKEKWQKIAAEAAKQCGVSTIPGISEVMDYGDFLKRAGEFDLRIIAYEATNEPAKNFLREAAKQGPLKSALVVIGPEGGFDESEVKAAEKAGFKSFSLGKNLLRCETAAITAAAILSYEFSE